MERTLILLKPDTLKKAHVGDVIQRFEAQGFQIVAIKMLQLTDELLKDHYSHIADKPFFPEVASFMASTPVIGLVLEGDNVIDRVRELLGPTDSTKADKGTIRGDFGVDKMVNVAHASDSPEAAEAEVKRFFKADELFAYQR
jgi:nucleoside-diphosphate kinase